MAFSFDISGQPAPASFGTSGGLPLAQLQPLAFASSNQILPTAIQSVPNLGYTTPSIKIPENNILQNAMSDLGKGITAAYAAKYSEQREDKKEAEKQQHEKELKQMELANKAKESAQKFEQDKILAGIKWVNAEELAQYKEGLKSRTGKKYTPVVGLPSGGASSDNAPIPENYLEQPSPNSLKRDTAPPSDAHYDSDPTSGAGGQEPPKVGVLSDQSISDLMQSLNTGSVKYLTAANAPAGSQADVPSAVHQAPSNPAGLQVPPPTLAFSPFGQSLASLSPVAPKQQAQPQQQASQRDMAIENLIGKPYAVSDADFNAVKAYAKAHNIPPPKAGVVQEDGSIVMKWPDEMTPYQKARTGIMDSAMAYRVSNMLNQDPKRFESESNVKNYMSQRGLMQMLVRLAPTFEAAMNDPKHSGIPDHGIAQLMAQAESGGVPAISTIEGYLHSQGFPDTIEIMKNKAMGGNSGLTKQQKQTIFDLLLEETKSQASLANQSVKKWQQTYGERMDNPEEHIAPFILPKTKTEAEKEIREKMIPEIAQLKGDMEKAQKEGKMVAYDQYKRRWEELSREARAMSDKIEKTKGHIVNFDEVLNTPQGFLAPVPISKIKKDAMKMLQGEAVATMSPAEAALFYPADSRESSSQTTQDSE